MVAHAYDFNTISTSTAGYLIKSSPNMAVLYIQAFILPSWAKGFHWLDEDNTGFIEISPNIYSHITSLMFPLGTLDFSIVTHRHHSILTHAASMPVSHATFAGLTTEELKALEDGKCQPLEVRLQDLHNIHILLDATIPQVNQYFTVLASLTLPMLAVSVKPTGETSSTGIMATYSTSITKSEATTLSLRRQTTSLKIKGLELLSVGTAKELPESGPDSSEIH
ncbi:hypothetical protein A6R68_11959, partial [Neotoma lepida]